MNDVLTVQLKKPHECWIYKGIHDAVFCRVGSWVISSKLNARTILDLFQWEFVWSVIFLKITAWGKRLCLVL